MSELPPKAIKCLDKGYVRLVDHMGADVTVVNAARVSFNKAVDKMGKGDKGLIDFLGGHGHTSPFRHAVVQFEMYVPMFIVRQHWKYVVGSACTMDAWNESSRRYVSDDIEFLVPDVWRSVPTNRKQGSGGPVSMEIDAQVTQRYREYIEYSMKQYEATLADGICTEQARLFLPANGLYVRYYWTCSLQSLAHVLNQRVPEDAQKEWLPYCTALFRLAAVHYQYSLAALLDKQVYAELSMLAFGETVQ